MNTIIALGLGLLAGGLDLVAAGLMLDVVPDGTRWFAAPLHLTAVAMCYVAARVRVGHRRVELDIVAITALCVPVVGPAIAWNIPPVAPPDPDPDARRNAHAAFELEEAGGNEPAYRIPRFTGDFDRDLSRELNTVSYQEVLRRGSLEQKRNLLRTLGRRAEPRHAEMIRQCLLDEDHEIRLCAYAEIDRLGRVHEDRIADLKARSRRKRDRLVDAGLLTELTVAQQDYAKSGILDSEMARFWFLEAIKTADALLDQQPENWRAATAKAISLAGLGELESAERALAALSEEDLCRPEVLLARADLAFAQRDYATARGLAPALRDAGIALPDWLDALAGAGVASLTDAIWQT